MTDDHKPHAVARLDALARAEQARAEQGRLTATHASGAVPDECGPAYVQAPARGPVRAVDFKAAYPAADGGVDFKSAGYQGRKTLVCAHPADLINRRAAKRKDAPVLSIAQVNAGRAYGKDVIDHAASGYGAAALDGGPGGGGTPTAGVSEAVIDRGRRIASMQRRLAQARGLDVRRVRPSASGRAARVSIPAREMVDWVFVLEQPLTDLLRKRGWDTKDGRTVDRAVKVLQAALSVLVAPRARPAIRTIRTDIAPDYWQALKNCS